MTTKRIKILIGEDKTLHTEMIVSHLNELGLDAITVKPKESAILDRIKREEPDAVIINLSLEDSDAIKLMDKCKSNLEDSPNFIVVSEIKNDFIERHVKASGALFYMVAPLDINTLVSAIKSMPIKLDRVNDDDIELIVTETIQKYRIPAHVKGYYYLRTGLIRAVSNASSLDLITKDLYPYIAKEHNTTPNRVERAIRSAIEIGWERGLNDETSEFYGFQNKIFYEKPKNSEFIAYIADKLRLSFKKKFR